MKKFYFISLAILSFLFTIFLTDFFLSNTFLKNNHCYDYESNQYYYELKKNCKGKYRFKNSFPLVKVYTDENGLRIGKNKVLKDLNKTNIFIFGDSFTYGVGIEFEKTYAGLLALNLLNYNVYNFAVGSYSPSVHLYKLKKALEKNLIPKKVIIFLDLTDVIDEATRWNYNFSNNTVSLSNNSIYKNNLEKKIDFKKKNFKILTNLTSYINYNIRFLKNKIKTEINNEYKIKKSIQGNFTYINVNELDKRFWKEDSFEQGLKKISIIFDKINDLAKIHNFEINLVIYPWAETLEFGQNAFNWSNFAKSICNDKCQTIDLIPDFIDYKNQNKFWSSDLYFVNDEHFNEKGAKLVYETLQKKINFN